MGPKGDSGAIYFIEGVFDKGCYQTGRLTLSSDVKETPDNSDESDDSISEFERNLRELMPDFLGDSESSKAEIPKKYSKK